MGTPFPVTGCPASLTELLTKELFFVLRQYHRRKKACAIEVQLLVPASYRPVAIGLDVDRVALTRDVLTACTKMCRDDGIPLPKQRLHLDLQFDPAVPGIRVRVLQFRPENASVPPFSALRTSHQSDE